MVHNSPTDNLRIDDDHHLLTQRTQLLAAAVEQRQAPLDQLALLEQLIDSSVKHFISEQQIMRRHNYQGLDAHQSIHDGILTQLDNLKQQLSNSQGLSPDQVGQLCSHLDNHIATHDRQLSIFVELLSDSRHQLHA